MENLNWIDYCILFVFFMSIMMGLARGFLREVTALLTWLVAFVVASVFSGRIAATFTQSPDVQHAMSSASQTIGMNPSQPVSYITIGICFTLLFVGTVIAGSMISYFLTYAVEGRGISLGNRLLGGLFGVGRGFIVVMITLFLVGLSPLSKQPFWLQSQFVQSFQPSVQWLNGIVSPGLARIKSTVGGTLQGVTNEYQGQVDSISKMYQGFSK